MEEDIKILEELIDDIFKYSDDVIIDLDVYRAGAMKRILLRLKEDEAVIEEMANSIHMLPFSDFKSAEDVIERYRKKVKGEIIW